MSQPRFEQFEQRSKELFSVQAAQNPLYAQFLSLMHCDIEKAISKTPFYPLALPIQFFKSHDVKTGEWVGEALFTSSGTTGQTPSRHHVRDLSFYLSNARKGFAQFYGEVSDWCILALLPSYLEREGASLVAMADDFIRHSKHPESGFFLDDFAALSRVLQHCRRQNTPTLLLGVSFALLDFAAAFPQNLQGVVVMETGGMKGRRKEITRPELHETLCKTFQINAIHSEYGMTELFSQAYAQGGARFSPASTLRVYATEANDPLAILPPGKTGQLNVIDLANQHTCAFLCTQDLGRVYPDGTFEVLGRLDNADIRGCNLMVEQ